YTDTTTLSFKDPLKAPATQDVLPQLFVTMPGGKRTEVTMDTGSTGTAISASLIDTTGLKSLGQGTFRYSSTDKIISSTFYQVPTVQISVRGSDSPVVTSNVQVLVVNDTCGQPGGSCTTMMGIGFDRGGSSGNNSGITQPTTAMNAFLNITAINGTAVAN